MFSPLCFPISLSPSQQPRCSFDVIFFCHAVCVVQCLFFKAKGGFNNIQLITEQLCFKSSLARAFLLVVAFSDMPVTVIENHIYLCVCVYCVSLTVLVGGNADKGLEVRLCLHQ